MNSLTTCAEWKDRAQLLEQIVIDFHWMARRYADGRQNTATSTFNQHTRKLLSMNIQLNSCAEGTIWARDGMGPRYSGLTEKEYNQGEPLDEWSKVVYPEEYIKLRNAYEEAMKEKETKPGRATCAFCVQDAYEEAMEEKEQAAP